MTNEKLLLDALKEARELVEHWGAYASQYFQEKHDLAGDLTKLDDVIRAGEKCLQPAVEPGADPYNTANNPMVVGRSPNNRLLTQEEIKDSIQAAVDAVNRTPST